MRHWSQGRLGLARRRIIGPDRYLEAREESWGADLTDADLALFAGDAATAGKGYSLQLVEGDSDDAWTGLGLALRAEHVEPAATALLDRPEVVRAVYREIVAQPGERPAPVEVAAWVGAAIGLGRS